MRDAVRNAEGVWHVWGVAFGAAGWLLCSLRAAAVACCGVCVRLMACHWLQVRVAAPSLPGVVVDKFGWAPRIASSPPRSFLAVQVTCTASG